MGKLFAVNARYEKTQQADTDRELEGKDENALAVFHIYGWIRTCFSSFGRPSTITLRPAR